MTKPGYGFGSRLLHRLALGYDGIAEASFDLEQKRIRVDINKLVSRKHVFVAGLSRSGTTILMRRLYSTGRFTSLTYRNMPFVLMPKTWTEFSRYFYRTIEKQERAHGDGVLEDFDSPEAFEEVFWRVFAGKDYIRSDRLVPMQADGETIEKFRYFIGSIVEANATGQTRYLSKNNNNVLRISSLAEAFPQSLVLIPFRDPVQQAFSLMNQFRNLISTQDEDEFSRKYMNWLVHHEFGYDYRPYQFHEGTISYQTEDINYWLGIWINTYRWLGQSAVANCVFVNYEKFCMKHDEVWATLMELADIKDDGQNKLDEIVVAPAKEVPGVDGGTESEARELFDLLLDKAI